MNILKLPITLEDMTAQVSLTGLTVLNEGKFKQRHNTNKEITQKPIEGFILTKNDTLEIERKALAPKRRKKQPITIEPIKPVIRQERQYHINKTEVTHRIRNFVNAMKGEKKLYFWTITFPANTSDDTAFVCFNKWVTRVRKELNLRSYLWVTERQKIGTVHFHIALHQRLCVKKANRFMRACLFTCIDNGEIDYTREAAKNYNGVDIAKNRKTGRVTNFAERKSQKSLVNYLTKYVSKSDQKFKHLAWHSSRDYSNLVTKVRFTEREIAQSNIKMFLNPEAIIVTEWFTFYKWAASPPPQVFEYLSLVNSTIISIINKN